MEEAAAGTAQWDPEAMELESGTRVGERGEQPSRGHYRTDVSGVMARGSTAQGPFHQAAQAFLCPPASTGSTNMVATPFSSWFLTRPQQNSIFMPGDQPGCPPFSPHHPGQRMAWGWGRVRSRQLRNVPKGSRNLEGAS